MNPDKTLHEHLEEHLQGMYSKRKANPQEGDVVKDLYGTQVYLSGEWHLVDYSNPDKVQALREQWQAMAERKQLHETTEMLNRSRARRAKHRGMDIGSASGGVHLHDDGKEKEIVHILSEDELDNQTLEAFNQGMETGRKRLLEELLDELSDNGQAVAKIQEKLNGME